MENCRKHILFLLAVLVIMTASSCTSLRRPLNEMGSEALISKSKDKHFEYDYFITDFNLNFSGVNVSAVTGQLRMKKDEVIWVRASSLGFEVARIKITPDSVFIINRTDKTYIEQPIENFVKSYYFNTGMTPFEMLQSVIMGDMTLVYDPAFYKTSVDSREYKIQTTRRVKAYERQMNDDNAVLQSIWIEPRNYRVTRMEMKGLEERDRLKAKYSSFEDVEQQRMATHIEILYISDKKNTVTIDYLNPETGLEFDFPFKVPKKYQKQE